MNTAILAKGYLRGHRLGKKRKYAGFVFGVAIAHALVLALNRSPVLSSDLLLDVSVLLAALMCLRRSRRAGGAARLKWTLIGLGMFVWCMGQTIITYNEGLLHIFQGPTAINSDFYFFLFGIPLLLTISSANESQRIDSLLWIDGLQAVVAIYLVHLKIFPGADGESTHGAISALLMSHAYDTENIVLAVVATLRLLARPRDEEKYVYRTLAGFLWVYAVAAALLNHLAIVDQLQTGTYWDLLWDLPFLVLALTVNWLPEVAVREEKFDGSWGGLLITNASPVVFTTALLGMGVDIGRQRFVPGMAAITFALVTYGLRSAIVQTHAMRTERKLLKSEAALLQANQLLGQLSFVDRLTGVANRRRFEEVLALEWSRATRAELPLSLLIVDIDHFKLLNDRYGHIRGDECLVSAAQALTTCLGGPGELLARYGGEEFVAILPGADIGRALAVAERMRLSVEALAIANEDASCQRMTVSIGVVSNVVEEIVSESSLFALADKALYEAKGRGRNRVEVSGLNLSVASPGSVV